MYSCGRKVCVCQKNIINWYMKAPLLKNTIFKNQLRYLEKTQKACSGSYKVMVDNLEIVPKKL